MSAPWLGVLRLQSWCASPVPKKEPMDLLISIDTCLYRHSVALQHDMTSSSSLVTSSVLDMEGRFSSNPSDVIHGFSLTILPANFESNMPTHAVVWSLEEGFKDRIRVRIFLDPAALLRSGIARVTYSLMASLIPLPDVPGIADLSSFGKVFIEAKPQLLLTTVGHVGSCIVNAFRLLAFNHLGICW